MDSDIRINPVLLGGDGGPVNDARAMVPPAVMHTTTIDPDQVLVNRYGNCNDRLDLENMNITLMIVCACIVLAGLIYLILGYRLFKAVMFVTGVLFGSVVVYIICDEEQVLPHQLGNASIALGAGVLFGLITMLVEYVGLFLTGFLCGLHGGVLVLVSMEFIHFVHLDSLWASILILFVSGLIMALLTLKWSRTGIIVGTSLIGAGLICIAVDQITQQWAALHWLYDVLAMRHPSVDDICWTGWMIVVLWPVATVLGTVIQCRVTGRRNTLRKPRTSADLDNLHGVCSTNAGGSSGSSANHRSDGKKPSNKRTATVVNQPPVDRNGHIAIPRSPASSNGTPIQSPYRKKSFRSLYRARQKHGDVICQSFMDSIERQRQSSVESNGRQTTLSSDNTRLTAISSNQQRLST